MRRSLTALLMLALAAVAQAQTPPDEESEDSDGPGAVPPPQVDEGPLASERAAPNFDNRNALEAFIDGIVETFMSEDRIAGVTLSIVKDDETVFAKGYGIAGTDPERAVDPEQTLFRIGSISKTFTWTALMQLAERNEIRLDDPINAYLPQALKIEHGRDERPVLVRDLMNHTPGLEDTALGHLFFDEPKEIPEPFTYLADHQPAQVRESGELPAYSNYGAALGGAIVSEALNQTFPAYAEQFILEPLEMEHTTFREPMAESVTVVRNLPSPMKSELADSLSAGFSVENGGIEPKDHAFITHIAPAGAASSTATDMARYMQAHLNLGEFGNAQLLSGESAWSIREAMPDPDDPAAEPRLAKGFITYRLPGGHVGFGHGGATLRFMSNMVMVPELGLGIFVSANTETGRPLVMRLPELIVGRYFADGDAEAAADADTGSADSGETDEDNDLTRFAGNYMSLRRPFTTAEALFMAVSAQYSVAPHDEGGLVFAGPGQPQRRFERIAPLTFREAEGADILAFRENDAGQITHLIDPLGIAAAQRVGFFARPAFFGLIAGLMGLTALGTLIGAWLRRKQTIEQTLWESRAGMLMPAMGGLWLVFLGLFAAATVGMTLAGSEAIFSFPSTSLVAALAVGLFAALVSLAAVGSLWPVWRARSWPIWRRIRHSLAAVIALVFVLVLHHWNLIGFFYY